MISELFLMQLFLTFVVGSTWIYLTVFSGSWFGSKIGGFIGGLPSTALLSFFFIGYTQSAQVASDATTVFPLAIGISGLFLVIYAWLVNRGFFMAMLTALFCWFLMSYLVILIKPGNFTVNLIIYLLIMFLSYLAMEKLLVIRSVSLHKTSASGKHILIRSVFGGLVITLTVFIAKAGGPMLGGIFSAFPAMFITTLALTYKVQGAEFSKAIAKSLLVTAMITIAVYSISLRYLYPLSGLYYGTVLCIVIAAISAYLTFAFILPRIK